MRLQFLGAAGTVTGSKYLLEHGGARILIDCGLFQGLKQLRLRNRAALPVPPASIDAVVLTHAHIDHTGYLPVLVRDGFRGQVFCTGATYDLCEILLPDSAYLQEEEATFANRHGYSRHHPALPLYTVADADAALRQLQAVSRNGEHELPGGLTMRYGQAGHIPGAAFVLIQGEGHTILFSGDLGRPVDPLVNAPENPPKADTVLLESTYGDRLHAREDPADVLADIVQQTAARGGVLLIPAFAVGRTQQLLWLLAQLRAAGRIPQIPTFVDSPMARDATLLLKQHPREHRLSAADLEMLRGSAEITNSVEESKAIDRRRGPMVLISASGMATGGRVLHHLKVFAPDYRNTILFAGFQAAGTRGAAMVDGADAIKIHGAYVPVRAEVRKIDGLSAHADAAELASWISRLNAPPRRIFLTHGEPVAADALRRRIDETLHWDCRIPEHLEVAEF
jgi:metallo-beta-lactamase family protein